MIKQLICAAFVAMACVACGNDSSKSEESTTTTETTTGTTTDTAATTAPAGGAGGAVSSADADAGLALIAKSDCLTCHKVEDKLVGPAYREVANKYPAVDTTFEYLSGKIIKGGAGVWGQTPMTPHPQLSKEDATLMAKYVMSLKQ